jgi:single-strand DNA-binding protein
MANTITITGNIGQPPELRYTSSQMAVCEFTVAVTSGKDDKKKTTWHTCKAFGKLAENICGTFGKGDTIMVCGRIEQDEYQKKDGTKGKTTNLIVDDAGASVRWNVWLKDRTEQVLSKVDVPLPKWPDDEEAF